MPPVMNFFYQAKHAYICTIIQQYHQYKSRRS